MEVPASISTADLTNMLNDAPSEEDLATCTCNQTDALFDGMTQLQVEDLVDDTAKGILRACHDPIVHKVLVLSCLSSLMAFHEKISEKCFNDGLVNPAQGWALDQGRLLAAYNTISSVQVGEDDFTCD